MIDFLLIEGLRMQVLSSPHSCMNIATCSPTHHATIAAACKACVRMSQGSNPIEKATEAVLVNDMSHFIANG